MRTDSIMEKSDVETHIFLEGGWHFQTRIIRGYNQANCFVLQFQKLIRLHIAFVWKQRTATGDRSIQTNTNICLQRRCRFEVQLCPKGATKKKKDKKPYCWSFEKNEMTGCFFLRIRCILSVVMV